MPLDSPLIPLYVRARKPLTRQEAGKRNARARWGPQRVVRLDDLTPDQRTLVLALIDAAKKAAPTDETPGAAELEEHGHARPAA